MKANLKGANGIELNMDYLKSVGSMYTYFYVPAEAMSADVFRAVKPDGAISNVQVARGVHPLLDKEAVRVVGLMPKWNPAMSNGDYLRVKYSVPVIFKLNQPNSSQSLRPSEAHRE